MGGSTPDRAAGTKGPAIPGGAPMCRPGDLVWPLTGATAQFPQGRQPTLAMVKTDTTLFTRWSQPAPQPWKGPPYRLPQGAATAPWSPQGGTAPTQGFDAAGIRSLQDYLQGRATNYLVPVAKPPAQTTPPAEPPKSDGGVSWKFGQAERKTKDGGIREDWQRGIREYIRSGYTRRNPDGKYKADMDWRGKWADAEYTVAEVSAKSDKASAAVAAGSFGNADSFFSGKGSVLGAEAQASAKAAITTKGVKADAKASASASLMEGEVSTNKDAIASASASAAVAKAEAEAKGELVLTAEQATLGGKLGASANLVEGKAGGEISITPTRVSRAAVSVYNWMFNQNATPLNDDWDFGIVVNGELSGAVGAQAEASAEAGYKKGKLRAEAGAKLGWGVGGGVKVGGGLTGLDKAWGQIKRLWSGP